MSAQTLQLLCRLIAPHQQSILSSRLVSSNMHLLRSVLPEAHNTDNAPDDEDGHNEERRRFMLLDFESDNDNTSGSEDDSSNE